MANEPKSQSVILVKNLDEVVELAEKLSDLNGVALVCSNTDCGQPTPFLKDGRDLESIKDYLRGREYAIHCEECGYTAIYKKGEDLELIPPRGAIRWVHTFY